MPPSIFVFIKIVSTKVQNWRACSEHSLSVSWPSSCCHDHYIGASKFVCHIGSLSETSDELFAILNARECVILVHQSIRHSIGFWILRIADQSLRESVPVNKVDIQCAHPCKIGKRWWCHPGHARNWYGSSSTAVYTLRWRLESAIQTPKQHPTWTPHKVRTSAFSSLRQRMYPHSQPQPHAHATWRYICVFSEQMSVDTLSTY